MEEDSPEPIPFHMEEELEHLHVWVLIQKLMNQS